MLQMVRQPRIHHVLNFQIMSVNTISLLLEQPSRPYMFIFLVHPVDIIQLQIIQCTRQSWYSQRRQVSRVLARNDLYPQLLQHFIFGQHLPFVSSCCNLRSLTHHELSFEIMCLALCSLLACMTSSKTPHSKSIAMPHHILPPFLSCLSPALICAVLPLHRSCHQFHPPAHGCCNCS